MQEYLNYQQYKLIQKSVIISDLILIIFAGITFYVSFFVNIKHFFIFAISCFFVKFISNFWVEKKYRFPSWIHLFAPIPFSLFVYISFLSHYFEFIVNNFNIFSYIIFLLCMIVIFVFVVFYFDIIKIFKYQLYYIKKNFKLEIFFSSVCLFNYYRLIGNFINQKISSFLFILQLACFLSIISSIFFGFILNLFGTHPIAEFTYVSLFAPLLWFILFNLIEIFVFLIAKFPKEGKYSQQTQYNISNFIVSIFLSIFIAVFVIASTPNFLKPFVQIYLGSQYESTMEKLIKLNKD